MSSGTDPLASRRYEACLARITSRWSGSEREVRAAAASQFPCLCDVGTLQPTTRTGSSVKRKEFVVFWGSTVILAVLYFALLVPKRAPVFKDPSAFDVIIDNLSMLRED